MIRFRCYSCWNSLGYNGPLNYIVCPRCDAKLYTGRQKSEILIGEKEYALLLKKLYEEISKNREISLGECETVAGESARYRPDAICYANDDVFNGKPHIYQIETPDLLSIEVVLSKSRLFSETAQNLFGKYYLVVPERYRGNGTRSLVEKILKESGIDFVEIVTI
ncbi:MAG: hypothetical protein ABIL44_07430 [candidate division WOR-3 bacterium]